MFQQREKKITFLWEPLWRRNISYYDNNNHNKKRKKKSHTCCIFIDTSSGACHNGTKANHNDAVFTQKYWKLAERLFAIIVDQNRRGPTTFAIMRKVYTLLLWMWKKVKSFITRLYYICTIYIQIIGVDIIGTKRRPAFVIEIGDLCTFYFLPNQLRDTWGVLSNCFINRKEIIE